MANDAKVVNLNRFHKPGNEKKLIEDLRSESPLHSQPKDTFKSIEAKPSEFGRGGNVDPSVTLAKSIAKAGGELGVNGKNLRRAGNVWELIDRGLPPEEIALILEQNGDFLG